jgi:hypothetical protein
MLMPALTSPTLADIGSDVDALIGEGILTAVTSASKPK